MIKKVTLKNFQSHKDSIVEFSDGVNTIIGTSDHGKSSIIRAIGLVKDNSPGGTEFISNWLVNEKGKIKGHSEVTLETDKVIKRIKGDGSPNEYWLDEEKYSAFGTGVPGPVTENLNLSDINFQEQKDSFFLLNSSSGEVMRKINSFVNLELIDATLSNADKAIRSNRDESKIAFAKMSDAKDKLEEFKTLPTLEKLYSVAEKSQKELDATVAKKDTIESVIKEISITEESLLEYKDLDTLLDRVNELTKDAVVIKKKQDERWEINNIVFNIDLCNSELDKLIIVDLEPLRFTWKERQDKIKMRNEIQEIVDTISVIENDLESLVPLRVSNLFTRVNNSFQNIKELEKDRDKLVTIIDTYNAIEDLGNTIKDKEEEYKELMPDVCPLCGNKCGCKE